MLSRYTVTRNGHLSEGVRRLYETVTGHPKLFVPVTVQSADPGSSASSPTWRTEQTCHVWSSRGLPLEICDKNEHLKRFEDLIAPYGIIEMVRTGTIAIQKGADVIAPKK